MHGNMINGNCLIACERNVKVCAKCKHVISTCLKQKVLVFVCYGRGFVLFSIRQYAENKGRNIPIFTLDFDDTLRHRCARLSEARKHQPMKLEVSFNAIFSHFGGRAETIVDEEDASRFKEAHYYLKPRKRKDGTERRYAFHDVNQLSDGLIVRNKSGRIKKTRKLLHTEILEAKLIKERGYGIRPGYMTDHVDGDGLNNRRSNLREATNAQNKANQRKQTGTTSKYKGVYKHPACQRLQVQIKTNKREIPLGMFRIENGVEAAQTYDAAALIIHPNCARLNFPGKPQPADIVERVKLILVKKGVCTPEAANTSATPQARARERI
jgi:hypothetical protein